VSLRAKDFREPFRQAFHWKYVLSSAKMASLRTGQTVCELSKKFANRPLTVRQPDRKYIGSRKLRTSLSLRGTVLLFVLDWGWQTQVGAMAPVVKTGVKLLGIVHLTIRNPFCGIAPVWITPQFCNSQGAMQQKACIGSCIMWVYSCLNLIIVLFV
jgi:hypothetical protein